mgnify:CR=1 FL=1
MTKYLKVDLQNGNGASICDTKEEVIEGCGYEVGTITFDELLSQVEGVYEIVEIKGNFELKWLNEEDEASEQSQFWPTEY